MRLTLGFGGGGGAFLPLPGGLGGSFTDLRGMSPTASFKTACQKSPAFLPITRSLSPFLNGRSPGSSPATSCVAMTVDCKANHIPV